MPIEAKLLVASDVEERFRSWAKEFVDTLKDRLVSEGTYLPRVHVVLKDPDKLHDMDPVLEGVTLAVSEYRGGPIVWRYPGFNISVEPHPDIDEHLSRFHSFYVFCPKSKHEDVRVLNRTKKASRQLRRYAELGQASVCFLGLSRMQDAHYVAELIARRFAGGQLSSISSLFMLRWHVLTHPPRGMFVDLYDFVINERAKEPTTPGQFSIKPIGAYGRLLEVEKRTAVPAYKYGETGGWLKKLGFQIALPSVSTLTKEMLA